MTSAQLLGHAASQFVWLVGEQSEKGRAPELIERLEKATSASDSDILVFTRSYATESQTKLEEMETC